MEQEKTTSFNQYILVGAIILSGTPTALANTFNPDSEWENGSVSELTNYPTELISSSSSQQETTGNNRESAIKYLRSITEEAMELPSDIAKTLYKDVNRLFS